MANLIELALGLASQGYTSEEIAEVLKKASQPDAIRQLTDSESELFAGAMARAIAIAPYYRDALALIRPFKDYTTPTLYTDKNSRVGIGDPFFNERKDSYSRAAELIHEAMHVMNHHFTRDANVQISPMTKNLAGDFEINPLVKKMLSGKGDLNSFVFPTQDPWRFHDELSFEQYSQLLKDNGFDQNEDSGSGSSNEEESGDDQSSENGEGSESSSDNNNTENEESQGGGNSSSNSDSSIEEISKNAVNDSKTKSKSKQITGCDISTPEREDAADKADIDKASSAEQTVARSNTEARIRDEVEKARSRGDQGALRSLQQMQIQMKPAKVNWRSVLRKSVAQARDKISLGRTDYSYRKVSKRLNYDGFIFPGMIQYNPSVMMAIDTSGSMTEKDFVKLLSELESIVRNAIRGKDNFKAFCVDAMATKPQAVTKVKDLNLRGGGGTAMEMAIKSVELIPRKDQPDLLIIATDGGTNWSALRNEIINKKSLYKVIILVTDEREVEPGAKTLQGVASVIDISEDG